MLTDLVKTPSHPRASVLRMFDVWNAFLHHPEESTSLRRALGAGLRSCTSAAEQRNAWRRRLGFRADGRVLALRFLLA